MIEIVGKALAAILIAVGVSVLIFLALVAALSKSFLARSVIWPVVVEGALIFLVTILVVFDVLAWWAAVPIVVFGSRLVFLALRRALPVGLSRFKTELKEGAPEHWRAGEIEGRRAAESLSAVPASRQEAMRLKDESLNLAERAHLEQEHHDGADRCYGFHSAFGDGFWGFVWSARPDLPLDPTPYRKQMVILRWVVLASVLVRLIGALVILGIVLSGRDPLPIRILEVIVGVWLLVWGASGFRLWRHPDWKSSSS